MQVLYFSTACFGTQFRLDINTNSFHASAKHIKQSLLALYPTHYILTAFVVPNQVGELFVLSLRLCSEMCSGSLLHVTSVLMNMD